MYFIYIEPDTFSTMRGKNFLYFARSSIRSTYSSRRVIIFWLVRCCYTTQRGALSVQNRQNLMKRNLHTKPHSRANPLQLTADRSFLKGVPNSTFFFQEKKHSIFAKLPTYLLMYLFFFRFLSWWKMASFLSWRNWCRSSWTLDSDHCVHVTVWRSQIWIDDLRSLKAGKARPMT